MDEIDNKFQIVILKAHIEGNLPVLVDGDRERLQSDLIIFDGDLKKPEIERSIHLNAPVDKEGAVEQDVVRALRCSADELLFRCLMRRRLGKRGKERTDARHLILPDERIFRRLFGQSGHRIARQREADLRSPRGNAARERRRALCGLIQKEGKIAPQAERTPAEGDGNAILVHRKIGNEFLGNAAAAPEKIPEFRAQRRKEAFADDLETGGNILIQAVAHDGQFHAEERARRSKDGLELFCTRPKFERRIAFLPCKAAHGDIDARPATLRSLAVIQPNIERNAVKGELCLDALLAQKTGSRREIARKFFDLFYAEIGNAGHRDAAAVLIDRKSGVQRESFARISDPHGSDIAALFRKRKRERADLHPEEAPRDLF